MADQRTIYREHAREYDELVGAEDREGNLGRALAEIAHGKKIVEVGAGTGRLTRILLEHGAREVLATEREPAMLKRAQGSIDDARASFAIAEAHALPVDDSVFDVGIAGWVFGHFRYWMPEGWRAEIGSAIDEMSRGVRAGGTIVIIETLGTGHATPSPSESLAEVYAWLELERGFVRSELRTDYEFASRDEAVRVLGFFFGEERASSMCPEGTSIVPECTAMFTRVL